MCACVRVLVDRLSAPLPPLLPGRCFVGRRSRLSFVGCLTFSGRFSSRWQLFSLTATGPTPLPLPLSGPPPPCAHTWSVSTNSGLTPLPPPTSPSIAQEQEGEKLRSLLSLGGCWARTARPEQPRVLWLSRSTGAPGVLCRAQGLAATRSLSLFPTPSLASVQLRCGNRPLGRTAKPPGPISCSFALTIASRVSGTALFVSAHSFLPLSHL